MSKVVRKLPRRAASPSADVETFARAKIKTLHELVDISAQAKSSGQRVVLAHGTFDLLHMGHVRHLEQARTQGDVLIVTITGDGFVNKGPGRPVFTSMLRAEMLAAVGYVDWVAINEAPTAENVISALKPDVYAKGSDYAEAENDKTGKAGRVISNHGTGRKRFARRRLRPVRRPLDAEVLEARAGIEPTYKALQASASPLCHRAGGPAPTGADAGLPRYKRRSC